MKLSRWSAALIALVFLYIVRDILPPFVIAIGLAYVLVPLVETLTERFHVPRALVVIGLYVVLLIGLGVLITFIQRPLAFESRALTRDRAALIHSTLTQVLGPQGIDILGIELRPDPIAEAVSRTIDNVSNAPGDAIRIAEQALTTLLKAFLILVVLFYLLLDWDRLGQFVRRFVPPEQRGRFETITRDIHRTLGHYVRGQLLLIFLVASVTWIFLRFVFHVPYALIIAVTTGFLEIIPLLGPVVATAIAAIVASARGGLNLALTVIAFYAILRQIEDQLVMPNVVGKAVHLHPVITLFAVLAGESLWGVLGALLAVPVAAAIKVVFDYTVPERPVPPIAAPLPSAAAIASHPPPSDAH